MKIIMNELHNAKDDRKEMMKELFVFQQQFKKVCLEQHVVRRNISLVDLMLGMEQVFDIPEIQNHIWEVKNRKIIEYIVRFQKSVL